MDKQLTKEMIREAGWQWDSYHQKWHRTSPWTGAEVYLTEEELFKRFEKLSDNTKQ